MANERMTELMNERMIVVNKKNVESGKKIPLPSQKVRTVLS